MPSVADKRESHKLSRIVRTSVTSVWLNCNASRNRSQRSGGSSRHSLFSEGPVILEILHGKPLRITFLGHAGFCVETEEAVVVMYPWLSSQGAFDAAWFQFPRNHHLAPFVREKLADSSKERYLYISHEHQDHFDRKFLGTLDCRDLSFVVPRFQRPALRNAVAGYQPKAVIVCDHEEMVPIPGGYLKLYLEDSGLNRDSAILVHAEGQSFLNLNDCKLYDELAEIVRREDPVSVFACQFSGATWHPICYDYPPEEYERISR